MKKMMKKLGVIGTATMLGIGAIATTFAYDDEKSLPGGACSVNNGADEGRSRHWTTGLKNASGSFLWVTCPMLQDEQNVSTQVLDYARVHIQQWPSQVTNCWLLIGDSDGVPMTSISGQRTGPGLLNWSGDYNTLAGGYYAIQCQLPPWSRLTSIWWQEDSGGSLGHETDVD